MHKAIVIEGSGSAEMELRSAKPEFLRMRQPSFAGLEVLGGTILSRVVHDLRLAGMESVTVIPDPPRVSTEATHAAAGLEDCWARAARELEHCAGESVESALIMRLGPYVEFDIAEAVRFQKECGESVVRAFGEHSPFDIWIVDPRQIAEKDLASGGLLNALMSAEAVRHEVSGYVNRLESPRDLRNLVVDSLNSRCRLRPLGFEVRPGVWMAEGAEVEKDARIVAPAYIGRQARVSQQCLITRGSSIECQSLVDYGTVIEDTTVLPNSYVGIGLDVSHSIVDGDKLLNLQHGVVVTIEDSAVMRQNKPLAEAECRWWSSFEREAILSTAEEGAN